ncbi:hypothetical protein D3C87_1542530 [compost metagenome]
MSRTVRNVKRKDERMFKPEDVYGRYEGYRSVEGVRSIKDQEHKHNRRVARKQEREAKREF